jgi:hypothetical protein
MLRTLEKKQLDKATKEIDLASGSSIVGTAIDV